MSFTEQLTELQWSIKPETWTLKFLLPVPKLSLQNMKNSLFQKRSTTIHFLQHLWQINPNIASNSKLGYHNKGIGYKEEPCLKSLSWLTNSLYTTHTTSLVSFLFVFRFFPCVLDRYIKRTYTHTHCQNPLLLFHPSFFSGTDYREWLVVIFVVVQKSSSYSSYTA